MDYPNTIITTDAQGTQAYGQSMAASVVSLMDKKDHPHVICLYGELGSGKTTFTQGFAKGLGITDRIVSPTFILMKRYEIPRSIRYFYHIDVYRIKSIDEIEMLGLMELLRDPQSVVVIEWPERIQSMLPRDAIKVYFQALDDTRHKIEVEQ